MEGLGSRIKLTRDKHERTQEELAAMLNVDRTTLGSWEIGRREPDLEHLVKIADIAGVSLDWLAGRQDASSVEQEQAYNDPKWFEIKELALKNNVKPIKIKQLIKVALALK